ncbi:MAG: NAD-dependent epimerase/dehydratase family protein, partial [Armatimonadetes bacterium]|nr:NAD-dependent epimerase/dehydratase family protein [Armatimonadota bacterium]
MEILVLGGSGNISREVVRALLAREHQVTCLTRGRRPLPAGCRALRADRQDRPAFEAVLREERPEVVIDLIAYHPDDTESALRALDGRFEQWIHCSTVMTYGPPIARLWADETTPLQAQTSYGQNKILIDELLLRRHAATGEARCGEMALTTLRRMAEGGIYDQLGGGFCRYSVDERWAIPHFEKMLYDNGPLLRLY